MFFSKLSLITTIFATNITKEVDVYKPLDVIDFLTTINEGTQMITDICEDIDEKYSLIGSYTKPECMINISYIDNNEFIVNSISTEIRDFLIDRKKELCKNEQIECGEVTIILKLIDIINNAVKLSVLSDNLVQLNDNLKIIDFFDKYIAYKLSITNIEVLTNITLSKQRSNVILTMEKTRLKKEMNKASYQYVTEFVASNIGEPIKNVFVYTGTLIGETFGETINNIIPSLSIEGKLIVFLGLIYLLKRC